MGIFWCSQRTDVKIDLVPFAYLLTEKKYRHKATEITINKLLRLIIPSRWALRLHSYIQNHVHMPVQVKQRYELL